MKPTSTFAPVRTRCLFIGSAYVDADGRVYLAEVCQRGYDALNAAATTEAEAESITCFEVERTFPGGPVIRRASITFADGSTGFARVVSGS